MTTRLLTILAAAGLMLSASAAQALQYTFTQDGWEGGALITGSFEGLDLNNDGFIAGNMYSNMNEITAFSVSYSGSNTVEAFSQTLTDLDFFSWKISTNKIGDDFSPNPNLTEGIATNWDGLSGLQYLAGWGVNSMEASWVGYPASQTYIGVDELHHINVTPAAVPLPGAAWLFGPALAGLMRLNRRHA